jgi:hypothetical protein
MSIQAYLVKVLLVVTYLLLLLWCHLLIDKSPGSLYIDIEPTRGTSHPLMEPVRIFCCKKRGSELCLTRNWRVATSHQTPEPSIYSAKSSQVSIFTLDLLGHENKITSSDNHESRTLLCHSSA